MQILVTYFKTYLTLLSLPFITITFGYTLLTNYLNNLRAKFLREQLGWVMMPHILSKCLNEIFTTTLGLSMNDRVDQKSEKILFYFFFGLTNFIFHP